MKNIYLILLIGLNLTACIDLDIIAGRVDSDNYLRNKNNGFVKNCENEILLKNSTFTDDFWKENNLPKGTTEFVCIKGKAYLPTKEPK